MTIKLLAVVTCFTIGNTFGQSVYSVPADSKGNHIILIVANESKTTSAQSLQVLVQQRSSAIVFSQPSASVKSIPIGKEAEVCFKFDVNREAKIGTNDTLLFLITDATGSTWSKSIVISYIGPKVYKLEQNFPNPFNPSTTIEYDLPLDSHVKLEVYDILGREVRSLVDEQESAGYQKARFDVGGVASGVYIYRIQAQPVKGGKTFTDVKKMMILK